MYAYIYVNTIDQNKRKKSSLFILRTCETAIVWWLTYTRAGRSAGNSRKNKRCISPDWRWCYNIIIVNCSSLVSPKSRRTAQRHYKYLLSMLILANGMISDSSWWPTEMSQFSRRVLTVMSSDDVSCPNVELGPTLVDRSH